MDEQEPIMTTSSNGGGSIADEMSTSTSSSTNGGGSGNGSSGTNGFGKKGTITSPDPTPYVAKARVTRPTPPPPSYNPMQFVQIKPCNLYQTAQEQLKKAEEVKKLKEMKKEEPEEWQDNLDSWKSSRRKRVEHIIDRVVETKKLESEEFDRTRRKSKTFSEMMEERAERGGPRRPKLASLAVYNEEETNDLSDLGIGTSSASGKSSLSEDYDNNSVMSDNPADLDNKTTQQQQNHKQHMNNMANHQQQLQQQQQQHNNTSREYVSSPGYDTSSSTAPASSPDPCEYTYEGAIQDYKARVTRAASAGKLPGLNGSGTGNGNGIKSKDTSPEHHQHHNGASSSATTTTTTGYPTRRGSKIEDRLIGFEVTSPSDNQEGIEKQKVDVPKIDISKRKEIFESQASLNGSSQEPKANGGGAGVTTPTAGVVPRVVLRERFKIDASSSSSANGNNDDLPAAKKEVKRLSGDITSIRDRMQSLEQQKNSVNASKSVDVPVPPLKERLSSLQNAVTKEDFKKPPVALVDARQLEIMKSEDERMKQQTQRQDNDTKPKVASAPRAVAGPIVEVIVEAPEREHRGRDDSGIHTSSDDMELLQEQQLNPAIAALALEEKQLEEAANAVNQIEAEFAELTDRNPAPLASASPLPPVPAAAAATPTATTTTTNENSRNMEFSINEALELALEAIDRENLLQEQQQQQHNEMPNKTDEEKNQIRNQKTTTQIQTNNKQTTTTTTTTAIMKQEEEEQQQQQQMKTNENKINLPVDDADQKEDQDKQRKINDKKKMLLKKQVEEKDKEGKEDADNINNNNDETITTNESNEAIIAKEPIYENLINSTVSMHKVETELINNIPTTTTTTTITSNNKKHNHNVINNNNHHLNHNHNNNHHDNNNEVSQTKLIEKKLMKGMTETATATEREREETKAEVNEHDNNNDLPHKDNDDDDDDDVEPYYQVPKSSEPYYDAPKHLRPIPLYENIEIFYTATTTSSTTTTTISSSMEPPKEKPPPPPIESPPSPAPLNACHDDELDSVSNGGGSNTTDTWSSSDNTYETITSRRHHHHHHHPTSFTSGEHPSPPIKRMNSTKRIKKELRNKRSSFLGIETTAMDDEDTYLELTVAPPPDMAQLLQEERRLEKQLYIKAGLCDSSDTGESRDSGVSENHSRQSSEHYTNSSEEHDTQLDTPPPPPQSSSLTTTATTTQLALLPPSSSSALTSSSIKHNLKQSQSQSSSNSSNLNPLSSEVIYQNEALLTAAQTPLLQTVKGNSAESWTESATVAAAASQSLSEATATATAKMLSIEEKIREQEEVLRVERELLHFSQEELKRQRENLLLRENLARRELQHGAKMLMSANRRSLQDLHGGAMSLHNGGIGNGMLSAFQPTAAKLQQLQQQQQQQHLQRQQQQQQQIYANIPNLQTQFYQVETDYRKSMSDLNEFSKRLMLPPTPPTKPMRAMHIATTTNGHHHHHHHEHSLNMPRNSLNMPTNGLVKIATIETSAAAPAAPTAAPRAQLNNNNLYNENNNYQHHHHQHYQSAQNLSQLHSSSYHHSNGNLSNGLTPNGNGAAPQAPPQPGNMSRNTLHALSATPKPKYTDGWVQVQNRKSYDNNNLNNDAAWINAYQQKRKSMPDYQSAYNGNHWLVQEAEQRRLLEQQQQQQQRRTLTAGQKSSLNSNSNGKPLPDSIIQTLTERVQSKGIGERKRFDNNFNHLNGSYHAANHRHQFTSNSNATNNNNNSEKKSSTIATTTTTTTQVKNNQNKEQQPDKVLSVSGKKKCSHCGDELGRGAAMIIESLLLFYHINCFKCCVCHVQLGDGLNGTDVRVRNQKLHCQNCYSSDDGIKFSCV